ncbi:DMT family transporter [Anaerosporobacter faecicola]|uniref:DMT family transporter n=1 Tax=Anaerosporobacter faecicola TaxID=2718714 RepID=UPI00143B1B63|nr:DMT family transporter [Anaerosporobacter faecicola]
MWGFLIAIVSGILMSVQGVFNTGVTKQTSVWVSSSFVQLTALVVCLVAWFVTGRQSNFQSLFQIDHKYMLLGGAMGAFITFTVIKSVATLGPAKAAMLIVVAQMVMSYVIELFGLFEVEKVPFQFRKLIGVALFIAGIITFKWE